MRADPLDSGMLNYLKLLATAGEIEPLQRMLLRPKPMHQEAAAELEQVADQIIQALEGHSEVRGFSQLYLLAALLLGGRQSWDCGKSTFEALSLRFLPDIDRQALAQARWDAMPVPLTLRGQPRIVHFLVALLPYPTGGLCLWPDWAGRLMDAGAQDAMRTCANVCQKYGGLQGGAGSLIVFPLLPPSGRIKIQGGSLGLPLALGCIALLRGTSVPPGVLASGTVLPDGTVGAVQHLEQKARALSSDTDQWRLLLYPAANPKPEILASVECMPVGDVEQAFVLASLFQPGSASQLNLFAEILRSPERMASECAMVPPAYIRWACAHGGVMGIRQQILASRSWRSEVLEHFKNALEHWREDACEAIGLLLGPRLPTSTEADAPAFAFEWYMLQVARANHKGQTEVAENWLEQTLRFEQQARLASLELYVRCLNHAFIHQRHNHYRFEPELPPQLARLQCTLEEDYQLRCREGCLTAPALGECYGTVCQNYGFCGPVMLAQTLRYAKQSMAAFGGGQVPEQVDNWRRQFCYQAYAWLDAGDATNAEQALMGYLQCSGWDRLWPRLEHLDKYEHAAIARFLAEAAEEKHARRYLAWAVARIVQPLEPEHPWQLWAWNVGRIAAKLGRTRQAADHYRKSMTICLSDRFGPTVHVMALLPFCGLKALGKLDLRGFEPERERIDAAAKKLDPEHFTLLRQTPFGLLLDLLWREPGRLFPFTYR